MKNKKNSELSLQRLVLSPIDFSSSSFASQPSRSSPHLCWSLICCPARALCHSVCWWSAGLVLLAIFENVQRLDFMPKNTRGTNFNCSKLGHRLLGDHKFVAATLTTAISVSNPLTRPDPAERSTAEPVNQTFNELFYTSHLSSTSSASIQRRSSRWAWARQDPLSLPSIIIQWNVGQWPARKSPTKMSVFIVQTRTE